MKNQILDADSYKFSHYLQLPPGTEAMFDYIEPRSGSVFDEVVSCGLQPYIMDIANNPIRLYDVMEAESFITAHGEPFNKEGFMKIVNKHGGYWPMLIKGTPEGLVVPKNNALVTVESTDPELPWVPGFIETAIQRAVWYMTTVATLSRECKKIIMKYLIMTSDDPNGQISFKLHDFGCRGVSSYESAGIGGFGNLIVFMGTDTVPALVFAHKYYGAKMAGFSIPAAEHSTITSWGKENEVDAYRNMLTQFAKPGSLVAVVSDSYDIYNACDKIWGDTLRQEVIDSGATVIIRPDSGDPVDVNRRILSILGSKFGYTVNSKGYKVLNNVRVIQGDGIDKDMIDVILQFITHDGWSADNIAFGMGGGLLQKLDRDTCSFAMKCSAIKVNGEWRDVYKQPVTQSAKVSKKGRLSLYQLGNGQYVTLDNKSANELLALGQDAYPMKEVLVPFYENGEILKTYSLDEVRANAAL